MGVENGDILDGSLQKCIVEKNFQDKGLLILQATEKSDITYVKVKANRLNSKDISISSIKLYLDSKMSKNY